MDKEEIIVKDSEAEKESVCSCCYCCYPVYQTDYVYTEDTCDEGEDYVEEDSKLRWYLREY